MFKVIIKRIRETSDATYGLLKVFRESDMLLVYECFTLEPKGGDCVEKNKDRRIPAGAYDLKWHKSQRTGNDIKGELPHLFSSLVPEDRYILIHVGNYAKDTEGCILVGEQLTKDSVLTSKEALRKLLDIIYKSPCKVVIENHF